MENSDPALSSRAASAYDGQPDTPTTDRHTQSDHDAAVDVPDNANKDADSDELEREAQPTTVTTPVYRGPFQPGYDPRRCDPRVASEASRGVPRAPSLIARLQRQLRDHPEQLDAAVQALLDAAGDPRNRHLVDANKVLLDRLDGPVVKRVEQDTRSVAVTAYQVTGVGGDAVTQLGSHPGAFQLSSNTAPVPLLPTSSSLPIDVGGGTVDGVGTPVLSEILSELRGISGVLGALDARVRRLESADGT